MAKLKPRKKKTSPNDERFHADLAPVYNNPKRKRFLAQGKSSFLDEFHTLYRRWVKNE